MLCCGHIHKTSQARGKSIGLSTDIPNSSLSANLSFALHVMGTVGLLPPTALEPFLKLGMVLRTAGASDSPIKGIASTKTTVSYTLSWKDYRSVNSSLVAGLMKEVEGLCQIAKKQKSPNELQVCMSSPVFYGEDSGPVTFIDVPFPKEDFSEQAIIVHQTLRQMEIPHSFHKYGLRLYTSPLRFRVVHHTLHDKQISLKDANVDGSFRCQCSYSDDKCDNLSIVCALSSPVTLSHICLQIEPTNFLPSNEYFKFVAKTINQRIIFKTTTFAKDHTGAVRCVGIVDVPTHLTIDDILAIRHIDAPNTPNGPLLFYVTHLQETFDVTWRQEPRSRKYENEDEHWNNLRDDRLVPQARRGSLQPATTTDYRARLRLANAFKGSYRNASFHHFYGDENNLPIIVYDKDKTELLEQNFILRASVMQPDIKMGRDISTKAILDTSLPPFCEKQPSTCLPADYGCQHGRLRHGCYSKLGLDISVAVACCRTACHLPCVISISAWGNMRHAKFGSLELLGDTLCF